ncbi:IS630 family transposase [Fusibacter sp. 3D3]|uniref:IS630 family transposase n=3 Tax=Fusibacter sp. 3D3 TaxID=1048380 RepID=UPI001112DB39|nr:IS630 family transposase [Fusibacter sp. 3D3]
MNKRKPLTQEQIKELLEAMRSSKIKREYRRIQAIYLYGTGKEVGEIAEITQLTPVTISRLYTKYRSIGLSSIPDAARKGRPSRLTEEQEATIKDLILNKTPADVGFVANFNWTAGIVAEYILREFKVQYSIKGITLILSRLNLSFTRPMYTLAKADPLKQEQFRKAFIDVKKLINGEIQHILFEDESMIRDYQAIGATWFERGKQKIIKTYGKHRGVKLVGCLDYESGDIYCEEHETYDAQTFLGFLNNVLERYSGKIVMVLDNARIHHAKLLQPFLLENSHRLELMYLPPYSPNLNLIEGLWGWLKEKVINNVFYNKTYEIRKNVSAFLTEIAKHPHIIIDRLCVQL